MSAYRNAGMDESRLVRDPAEGVAIAKCLIYRIMWRNKIGKVDGYHPEPCRWCRVDRGNLQVIYDEWMSWSMLERDDVALPSPVENFMRLPADTQAHLVRVAQGYEEEHVPGTHHVPKSIDGADPHPDGGDRSTEQASSGGSEQDHHSLAPGWTTGGTPGGVRPPRQQRRRS